MEDHFGPTIHSYSRADAIEDGNLVDVSETAREAGFTIPVAITRPAWESLVAWTDEDTQRLGVPQDESGRLWDVVWMAAVTAKSGGTNGAEAIYQVACIPRERRASQPELREVKLHIGPGDTPEPVITIMLPDED